MEGIYTDPKCNATGQELLEAKMMVNSSVKGEAIHCKRCQEAERDKKLKESRGKSVTKRTQCSHCHCSLFVIDDELLANLRNCEPAKKEVEERKKRILNNIALKSEMEEKKAQDKVEYEIYMKMPMGLLDLGYMTN